MIIEQILAQLDELFTQHKVDQVENFLLQRIDEAAKEKDTASMITLLNEIIGHYREMGEFALYGVIGVGWVNLKNLLQDVGRCFF